MSSGDRHPDAERLLRDLHLQAARRLLAEAGRDGLVDEHTPLGEVGPDDEPATVWERPTLADAPTRVDHIDETRITHHQDSASPRSLPRPDQQTQLGGHAIDALRARTSNVEDRLDRSADATVDLLVEVKAIRWRMDVAFWAASLAGMLLAMAMALGAVWMFAQWMRE